MIKASHDILLQEGEYRKSEKKRSKAVSAASSIYWCIATAVYFVWSFLSKDWKSTWIVWPIAGVLFAPYIMVVKQFGSEKDENG